MENTELIEKLVIIMDRLDRMERKIDELSKKQNIQYVPQINPTYPMPQQIWYEDKKITDFDKITCISEDYSIEMQPNKTKGGKT